MDGFTKLPKMQCFKEGGSVKSQIAAFEKKESKSEGKMDKAQDKAMVKKGVRQHESALHKGEPKTELKLKQGGRAKKAAGTVKKFEKASGEYGAKKTATDKKNIAGAKKFKPAFKEGGKACAPSAAKKAKNKPAKMCGGGMPKYSGKDGSYVDVKDPQALTDKIALEENTADANIIPNALKAVKRVGKQVIKTAKDAFTGQGAVSDAERSNINKKKGGKIKKYAEGGAVLSDDEKAWLGGADATDPFILARMRSALGDKKPAMKPQGSYIPNADPAMDNRDVGAPAAAPSAPVRSTDIARLNQMAQGQGVFPEGSAALPTSVAAPRPKPRPVRSTDIARLNQMAKGQGVFPEGSEALPTRPYAAPNVEQDSGLEYPIKPGFFSATPGQQATQFNKGAQQRKNIGRRIGNFFGMNKDQG